MISYRNMCNSKLYIHKCIDQQELQRNKEQ